MLCLLPHAVPAVFDTVDLFLPDVQFETEAAYVRLPHTVRQRLKEAGECLLCVASVAAGVAAVGCWLALRQGPR